MKPDTSGLAWPSDPNLNSVGTGAKTEWKISDKNKKIYNFLSLLSLIDVV